MAGEVIAVALPEPALTAGGLWLRTWRDDDAQVVLAAGRDELISRYRYSLPRTNLDAQRWITRTPRARQTGGRLGLRMVDKRAGLGSGALADIVSGNATIRYWLLPHG